MLLRREMHTGPWFRVQLTPMAISRRIARPMLASIFVVGGLDAFRDPASKAARAAAVTEPLRQSGFSNVDTETMVRVNGGVQFVAGTFLALGRCRRVACLLLLGSLLPTTYAGHRFWEETDRVARTQQLMNFLKNVGLMGGLIVTALDTEGQPSLGWRTRHAVTSTSVTGGIGAATDALSRLGEHLLSS